MSRVLIITLALITLVSCRKDHTLVPNEPELVGDPDCIADLYKNENVATSVEIRNMSATYEGNLTATGIGFVEELSSLNEVWFQFSTVQGEPYKIWWQDSWWEEYTAGSIYVTAYMNDTSTTYFPEERLIAMNSSAMFIVANETGSVFIRVRPFDEGTSLTGVSFDEGTFAVHADSLYNTDKPVVFDSLYNLSIDPGGVELFSVDVLKDSIYTITADASPFAFAYGEEISVNMSVIPEYGHVPYFYAEQLWSSELGFPENTVYEFVALQSGRIYIAFNGAYWWTPRTVDFKFSKL